MSEKSVQKTCIVGGEWLYYKIYCGVKTADLLLIEFINPLVKELLSRKIITHWFFIRYSDPQPHLRIRFHLTGNKELGNILLKIKNLLLPYIETQQIWEVQLATYQREIERYGSHTIETSEKLFFYDSRQIISIIEDNKEDEARFLTIFHWIENWIHLFNFEDQKLLSFLDNMQTQFKQEFKVNKIVRKELSNQYRKLEQPLFTSKGEGFVQVTKITTLIEHLLNLNNKNALQVSLESLLASYIHMTINRCFRSKQRLHEMMLYDFLYRKNNSKFARYGKL